MPSKFLYTTTPKAVIPAITNPIGDNKAPITVNNVPVNVINKGKDAVNPAKAKTMFLVCGSSSLNAFDMFFTNVASFLNAGITTGSKTPPKSTNVSLISFNDFFSLKLADC